MHFIREVVQTSSLDVVYVMKEENDADVFTKQHGRGFFEEINERLALGGAIEEEC